MLLQVLVQNSLSSPPETQATGQAGLADMSHGHVGAWWLNHDLQSLVCVQVKALAHMMTSSCLDGAVDLMWIQRHKRVWKMAVRRSIQQQNENIALKTGSTVSRWSQHVLDSNGTEKVRLHCLL